MTALCSVIFIVSKTFSRLSLTGEIKSFSDIKGEIWVTLRLQHKVKGEESLFLTQSAMCNSPYALHLADMPTYQADVDKEILTCEHFCIIWRLKNKH